MQERSVVEERVGKHEHMDELFDPSAKWPRAQHEYCKQIKLFFDYQLYCFLFEKWLTSFFIVSRLNLHTQPLSGAYSNTALINMCWDNKVLLVFPYVFLEVESKAGIVTEVLASSQSAITQRSLLHQI